MTNLGEEEIIFLDLDKNADHPQNQIIFPNLKL